ncbi:MAG: M15 family metallopeptidase [Brotaphodocola sp.]
MKWRIQKTVLFTIGIMGLCTFPGFATSSDYGPGFVGGGTSLESVEVQDYHSWKEEYIARMNSYEYGYQILERMDEGDFAGNYYYDNLYHYPVIGYNGELEKKVQEQYKRIEANPTAETAAAEMTTVEIPVWRLSNGQKIPSSTSITVMSSIADEVTAIFTEIFNGPEQFPINSVGGYAWRSNGLRSYHSSGLAIDINSAQNPQVAQDGTVITGGAWEPYLNPYSITPDGDVAKAFGKYGWYWGANYDTKDYMHFSY